MSGIDMFRSRSIRLPSCGEQFMMQRKKEMIENELTVLQGLYHINPHERKELLLKSNRRFSNFIVIMMKILQEAFRWQAGNLFLS